MSLVEVGQATAMWSCDGRCPLIGERYLSLSLVLPVFGSGSTGGDSLFGLSTGEQSFLFLCTMWCGFMQTRRDWIPSLALFLGLLGPPPLLSPVRFRSWRPVWSETWWFRKPVVSTKTSNMPGQTAATWRINPHLRSACNLWWENTNSTTVEPHSLVHQRNEGNQQEICLGSWRWWKEGSWWR